MDELFVLDFPTNDLVSIAATPNDDALFGSSQNESFLSSSGHDLALGYAGKDLSEMKGTIASLGIQKPMLSWVEKETICSMAVTETIASGEIWETIPSQET